ncbi:hypothetical protein JCM8547_002775 [Rhodosporidiobolus lusitaniae]
MPSRRPPPCLTVRIPGKPAHRTSRNLSSSILGISTYSHRIAKRSHKNAEEGRASTDSTDSTDMVEAAAVALAQVGSRAPSRLVVRRAEHNRGGSTSSTSSRPASTFIPISVDVQPPTPDPSSLPVSASSSPSTTRQRSRSAESLQTRAAKQSRRVAPIYSITSSAGGVGPAVVDLSGSSSLTLNHLPSSVSLEDLTIHTADVSSTGAVEHVNGDLSQQHSRSTSSASSLYSTASPSSPVHPPSSTGSHLPLSTHAFPPAQSSLPDYYTPCAAGAAAAQPAPPLVAGEPSRFREVLGTGPGGPIEMEADRLKRLYLCPWEAKSPPRPSRDRERSASLRSRSGAVGVGVYLPRRDVDVQDPEKGGFEEEQVGGTAMQTRAEKRRKQLVINLALVLLGAAIFADLLVLNIRVFTGRDAYLSE